jgi:hypothetical protein
VNLQNNRMAQPVVHPDVLGLRDEVLQLRESLRRCSEEWHWLTVVERPRLTALYETHFGKLERKLQYLAVENAELFRRIELLSIKIARGERLTEETVSYVDMVVDREYARFRKRVREAFDMTPEQRNAAAHAGSQQGELVSMYRTLVKKLHPDSGVSSGSTSETWHHVQAAYAAGNVAQLASLLAVLESRVADEHTFMSMDLDRLIEERDRLQAHVRREQRKLAKLQNDEPFVHAPLLEDSSWQDAHKATLLSEIDAKLHEWNKNKERYKEITGSGSLPGTRNTSSEDDDDFMNATYFGQR